jgi:hypothetical protein
MKAKILKAAIAVVAMSMFAGCVVLSVYPFYTPKDLISDPGLAGRWSDQNATNNFWQISAAGAQAYSLAIVDEHSTNGFDVHLFQLRQYQFLDLRTTNRTDFQLPLHLVVKCDRAASALTVTFMDYGWLEKLLATNPAAVRHIVVPENPDDKHSSQMVYLTAETKELQKFLLKHAADTNAFNSPNYLKRQ